MYLSDKYSHPVTELLDIASLINTRIHTANIAIDKIEKIWKEPSQS